MSGASAEEVGKYQNKVKDRISGLSREEIILLQKIFKNEEGT
jgi:hypothetical protein